MNTVSQENRNIKGVAVMVAPEPEWVPITEVARRFSVSIRSIYRYISMGVFPRPKSIRGRKNLFNLCAVRAYFSQLPEGGTH